MSNALSVIPVGTQLPAHLMAPDAAAEIAAANAAAAGGIKAGGFPRISIKGGKFHEVDGGETNTYMMAPASQGQPALPMMCFEAIILNANPNLSKTYYPGDYKDGDDAEPACSSDNGLTPDAHITAPQHTNCAECPQNQWGSKISKASQKEVKACNDSKRLAVLPAWFPAGLAYKALGLTITPSALGDWGKYVKALSEKGIPVNAVVTNLTFDANAAYPKLQFAFNRFVPDADYIKVKERMTGDDVKLIVATTRTIVIKPAAQLPAPTTTQAQPPAAQSTPAPAAPVVVDPYAGQLPHVKLAVEGAGGLGTPDGLSVYKAITGKDYVAPVAAPVAPPAPVVVDPFASQPPHVRGAVDGAGGLGTPNGDATYKALTGKDAPVATAAAPAPAAPGGFGAAAYTPPAASGPPAGTVAMQAANAPEKQTRKPRAKPAETTAADPALAHLPPAILAAVIAVGKDSPAGIGLLATYPAPAVSAPAPVSPPPAAATPPAAPAPSTAVNASAVNLAAILAKKLGIAQPGVTTVQ